LQRTVVGVVLRHPLSHIGWPPPETTIPTELTEHEPSVSRKRASSSIVESFFKPIFFNADFPDSLSRPQ
jgi:hypothetical protein